MQAGSKEDCLCESHLANNAILRRALALAAHDHAELLHRNSADNGTALMIDWIMRADELFRAAK